MNLYEKESIIENFIMEMKFFLGCAFYHSRMKLIFPDTKSRNVID